MNMLKQVITAAAVGGALFVTGSAYVPGTAEAHCGGHANTCGPYEQIVNEWCDCWGGFVGHWTYTVYQVNGYCYAPASGCSGAGCINWPCAAGQCGSFQDSLNNHGCYTGQYYEDAGTTCDCE